MTPFVYTVPIAAATVPRCEALYVACKQGRQDRVCGAIEGGYPIKSVESTHTSATVRCHDCFAALAAPPPEHISSNLAMLGNKVTQPCAHSAARAARAMGAPCQPRDPAVPAGCPMVSNGGLVDAPSKHAHTPIRRETRKQYIHSVMDKQNRTHP